MRFMLLIALVALSGCAQLFFHPDKAHLLTPNELRISYQDIDFYASDGTRLHAWLLPAQGEALATILFLHGNAQNISAHIASVYWLVERRFNVFLLDYRGYGASEGHPSLAGIHADADAALHYLVAAMDANSEPLIVFGQSLGGAVAIRMVAHSPYRDQIRALIVEGAFASYPQIAQEKLAELWLTWPLQLIPYVTVSGAYDAVKAAASVSPVPLVIVHGETDAIVPAAHAHRLYQAAQEPKQLWVIPSAGHIEAFSRTACRDRLVRYLQKVSEADPRQDDLQARQAFLGHSTWLHRSSQ